ncbi:MAG: hypothetical protein ABI670_06575 [Chloroflexota bacterium]
MKLTQRFSALFAVAIVGLGILLSGCGEQTAGGTSGSGSANQDAVKNQFLADRSGNGTPGVTASGTALPGGGGRASGLFGTVEKVDGNKLTIKALVDGAESVIQVSDTTTIGKQAQAQASEIKVGDTVTAIGTKDSSGSTINAQSVQIGGGGFGGGFGAGRGGGFGRFNGTPGTRPNGGTGAFPSGTPPAGFVRGNGQGGPNAQGTPGVARDFASGSVEKIDGSDVTVKSADGSSATFKIGADTRIQKQVQIKVGDIKQGDNVTAAGQQNGDIFEATSLEIVEAFVRATPTP